MAYRRGLRIVSAPTLSGGFGGAFKKWEFDGGDEGSPASWKHDEGKKELATFGAGCYWGTEKFYANEFAQKYPGAILGTSVGLSLIPL